MKQSVTFISSRIKSHVSVHKHFLTSKALSPPNATVIFFSYPKGSQFNRNYVGPPSAVNFPMAAQRRGPKNSNLTDYLHNRGYMAIFNDAFFPYGFLLNIVASSHSQRSFIMLTAIYKCTQNHYSCSYHDIHYFFLFQLHFHLL